MKKTASILVVALGMAAALNAQEKKEKQVTPSDVIQAGFQQKFPGAAHVKWKNEDGGSEAHFEQNGVVMSALFDKSGALKETEREIAVAAIPAAAAAYLQQHYTGRKVKEAARIEQADGTVLYEAELGAKDILFDVSGNFIKEVAD